MLDINKKYETVEELSKRIVEYQPLVFGLSVKVAKKAGLHFNTVSKYLKGGTGSYTTMIKVLKACEIVLEEESQIAE